jgi:hypothetical protein
LDVTLPRPQKIQVDTFILERFPKPLDEAIVDSLRSQVKKYKLFQFLNDAGKLLLEGYIQDAINGRS